MDRGRRVDDFTHSSSKRGRHKQQLSGRSTTASQCPVTQIRHRKRPTLKNGASQTQTKEFAPHNIPREFVIHQSEDNIRWLCAFFSACASEVQSSKGMATGPLS
ncbi:unnamed protein product [Pleuronectes platessa]|uniref:Uncharacterized protein n=1 Tax=Pleuronectes platessa TaxID=8262 RepID=A0A9N7TQX1_PLEPL|nr:unnamed protein product [Pleuronectes platessa]